MSYDASFDLRNGNHSTNNANNDDEDIEDIMRESDITSPTSRNSYHTSHPIPFSNKDLRTPNEVKLTTNIAPVSTDISLSSPEEMGGFGSGSAGQAIALSPQSRLDTIKSWSFSTYKFTKQLISEKMGRGSRTIDSELEASIELVKITQQKYLNILKLSKLLTAHFTQMMEAQKLLGGMFSEMSQKNPELHEQFMYNAETQRVIHRNGESLLGALTFFNSSVSTLCHKTMEDTLITVGHYQTARVEYDAYRADVESLQGSARDSVTAQRLADAQAHFQTHKHKLDTLRSDVAVKIKFLDENRVKVMEKQLLLFHNAIASYFSGNQAGLEDTLRQFNISHKTPNNQRPSWLELNK